MVFIQFAACAGKYKIITQGTGNKNIWVPPSWPADADGKKPAAEQGKACNPCIFNIMDDREERNDLLSNASNPTGKALAKQLGDLLAKAVATKFQTGDDGVCTHTFATHCLISCNTTARAANDRFFFSLVLSIMAMDVVHRAIAAFSDD